MNKIFALLVVITFAASVVAVVYADNDQGMMKKLEKARDKFMKAKQKYMEARDDYRSAKMANNTNDSVYRVDVGQDTPTNLAKFVYTTANETPHDPFKLGANPLGPYAKGMRLDMTLRQWLAADGTGMYTPNGDNSTLNLSFQKLVPSGVYTVWCSRLTFPPNFGVVDAPCGSSDGSQNTFNATSGGTAVFDLQLAQLPESSAETATLIAVAYHSDGMTYGSSPGPFGQKTHVQVFASLPVPNASMNATSFDLMFKDHLEAGLPEQDVFIMMPSPANITNITTARLDKAKTFLLRTLDGMISHLELIKSKVEDSNALSDEEKANITADIDVDIAWFTGKKTDVQDATTLAQLNELKKEIRSYWTTAHRGIMRAVGRHYNAQLKAMLNQAERLEERIQDAIDKLKAAGTDTEKLESWLADFSEKVGDAKQKYEEARQKLMDAETRGERKDILDDAHAAIKDGHDTMKDAVRNLKDIIKEMK